MEKTMCQRCFHYEACCAIDLTGTLGNPELENSECEHFVDGERVKIQDKAHWKERINKYYYSGGIGVEYRCSHCNNLEKTRYFDNNEWDEYYSKNYREKTELPMFCAKCGFIVEGYEEI